MTPATTASARRFKGISIQFELMDFRVKSGHYFLVQGLYGSLWVEGKCESDARYLFDRGQAQKGRSKKIFFLLASGSSTDPQAPGDECPELWNEDIGV